MESRIWAIVPAAGVGARMQANVPKQYLPLAGKTVIEVTLNKLLSVPGLAGCIVALSQGDPYFSKHCRHIRGVTTVTGGAERAASVRAGLEHLVEQGFEQDWALVHDAARPCVKPANVLKLMRSALQHGCGALLAVPAADTLKKVHANAAVETVDRSQLWHAHTPQMFRAGELLCALKSAAKSGLTITDESSAMEATGARPAIVCDSRDNIKITQAEDLALAEWILAQQSTQ